ncbi:hypothetical protein ISG33_08145 [Glaciecola sp. MH2013]|uniref:hypothetical protein n=1 Tax=Glaciecola sp. MH2013 TaxID=2785524 RepID=UPI00189FD54C|nr:hypothetical protein [Glaciecola sp. MH2013]MBF7073364.1 hypothetical protein [Glaciecola sp. MH2013]
MARLSQKAWNNVIIFSMLTMIIALNIGNFQNSAEDLPFPIVEEGGLILSLEIDQVVIERAGTSWRINPDSVNNLQSSLPQAGELTSLVDYWQRALLKRQTRIEVAQLAQPDHIVVIWLAGERNGLVVPIKRIDGQAYVLLNDEALLLDFPTLAQLTQW